MLQVPMAEGRQVSRSRGVEIGRSRAVGKPSTERGGAADLEKGNCSTKLGQTMLMGSSGDGCGAARQTIRRPSCTERDN